MTTNLVPVLRMDVTPYAKKNCNTCQGKGEFKVTRVVDRNGNRQQLTELCGCAVRLFFKRNPGAVQDPVTRNVFWPATKAEDANVE